MEASQNTRPHINGRRKGQVNVALQVLEELQLDIAVCGMVKDDNHGRGVCITTTGNCQLTRAASFSS